MARSLLKKVYDKETHIFVYDKYQKDFYLDKGLSLIDSDFNSKTGKIFWVFTKSETNKVYGEWLSICKSRHDLV